MSSSQRFSPSREAGPGGQVAGSPDGLAPLAEQVLAVLPMIPRILIAVGLIQARLDKVKKALLTVDEFAEEVGRAPYTIRQWIRLGRIRAIRVPGTGSRGRFRIPHEELTRLVATGLAGDVPAVAID